MAYARVDAQIGYVQGMNIVCSVLLYHELDINSCVQVMKFLMIACGFRQVYLHDFELAHKLAASLTQALKYRCSDLHRHLVNNGWYIDRQIWNKFEYIHIGVDPPHVGQYRAPGPHAHGCQYIHIAQLGGTIKNNNHVIAISQTHYTEPAWLDRIDGAAVSAEHKE